MPLNKITFRSDIYKLLSNFTDKDLGNITQGLNKSHIRLVKWYCCYVQDIDSFQRLKQSYLL